MKLDPITLTASGSATRRRERALAGSISTTARALVPCALLVALATSPACRNTRRIVEHRVEYDERVELAWSVEEPTTSVGVQNLGPGSAEAELKHKDGTSYTATLREGDLLEFMLAKSTGVEIRSAAAGKSTLKWFVRYDRRDDVKVKAD